MLPLQNGGIGIIVRNTVEERSRKKTTDSEGLHHLSGISVKKKGLDGSVPIPSFAAYNPASLSGYFHYMYTGFLCISLIVLTSPVF